jgi:hypothetical protein
MSRDAILGATNLFLRTPLFGIGRVSRNGSVLNRWKLEKESVASVYFLLVIGNQLEGLGLGVYTCSLAQYHSGPKLMH